MKLKNFSTILIFLVSFILQNKTTAQELIEVTVSNNKYTPKSVTINIGDTVQWTNIEGSHNVNGKTSVFPSNPESFSNSVGSNWVFKHVFTIEGTYNYQCDPHASFGMTGSVIVLGHTGFNHLSENKGSKFINKIYPNPSSDYLIIEFLKDEINSFTDLQLIIVDISGREIYKKQGIKDLFQKFDIINWESGMYIYYLSNKSTLIETGKFMKK